MAVNPSAFGPKPQIEVAAGTPAVGGRLFFYVAGSVGTKQNTYTDSTGGVANTNPVVLDSLGFPTTTEIWWTAGLAYKVVYAPPGSDDPPNSPVWTVDNLRGNNDTTSTFDQWIAGPIPTFISTTSFSLVGDQTGTFQIGRRIKTTNSGGTIYSTITASAFAAVTTVTVSNDSGVLDSGLSAVSYGLISSDNTSRPTNGEYRSSQIFTSSGTYTTPAGLKHARITVIGGGGGSGGAANAAATTGGAGGGGGTGVKTVSAATVGASKTVTVGAGGAAGVAASDGGAGVTSSFGAIVTATGGAQGLGAGAGGTGASGAGGVGASGDYNVNGGAGISGMGGANIGSTGGNSSLGGGAAARTGASLNGTVGGVYGGGASGGISTGGGSATGAIGGAGIVIVEEFF